LAQRAKIDELSSSGAQKEALVSQLRDNVAVLNDTIKGNFTFLPTTILNAI
jgi:hypothetical protein